ncbi:hypothetical protein V8G54_006011 [Vigna mungo]|uniref:E3 ubiquitin-protein ligase RMA n=1 Tax=Vigna mungo TaxID=3915 RepID=A0AAQ3NZ45_VIGMU
MPWPILVYRVRTVERIRRLVEVVPSMAGQHQSQQLAVSYYSGEQVEGMQQQRVEERIDEGGKRRMMKGVKLIAKALEDVERSARKQASGKVGFFDCNICLLTAKDPVLTCCGHLFCWPCFYHLPCSCSCGNARLCPVCDGEVIETNITPIYGNSSGSDDSDVASSIVPPRPAAPRINSFSYYF